MAYGRRYYFRECPFCGAALDPGETCDCRKAAAEQYQGKTEQYQGKTEQYQEEAEQDRRIRPVHSRGEKPAQGGGIITK